MAPSYLDNTCEDSIAKRGWGLEAEWVSLADQASPQPLSRQSGLPRGGRCLEPSAHTPGQSLRLWFHRYVPHGDGVSRQQALERKPAQSSSQQPSESWCHTVPCALICSRDGGHCALPWGISCVSLTPSPSFHQKGPLYLNPPLNCHTRYKILG